MKYEEKIVTNENGTPVIKGTTIGVYSILRMLEEGKTMDEIIMVHPLLSNLDISACLEYATELVIVSDFNNLTKKINEHFNKRHALADRIRKLADKPFIFRDKDGNEIDLNSK